MKFRKKPVVVEAIRIPSYGDLNRMLDFDDWMVANQGDRKCRYAGDTIIIPTLEGDMVARIGDWIIRGVAGELYPCKPDIFSQTYELVESGPTGSVTQ